MKKGTRLAAHLPYPLIFLLPARAGGIGHIGQKFLGGAIEDRQPLAPHVHRTQELPVHIELPLVPGSVANPNRPARSPTGQARQLAFRARARVTFKPSLELERLQWHRG